LRRQQNFSVEEKAMKTLALCSGCGVLTFLVMAYQTGVFDAVPVEREATEEVKPAAAPFPEALTYACQGKPVAQAAEYVPGPEPHPFVIFHLDGASAWTVHEDWQEKVREEWQATTVEKTEFVVIVGKQKKVFVDRTPFQIGPPVDRFKFELDVYVRAARTGEVLCHKHFINRPRDFREYEEYRLTALGEPVAYKTVFAWVTAQAMKGFVQDNRPIITKTKYQ
jgi:hypothetical protein